MKDSLDKKIEEALKTEFEFSLPADFALQLVNNLEAIHARSDRRLKWILAIVFGTGLIVSIITMMVLMSPANLKFITDYSAWIFVFLSTFLTIQYLDKRFIQPKIQS